MKISTSHRAAFVNLRLLIASLLCLTAGMLTLFAFATTQQADNNTQATSSSRWFSRLASTLGMQSPGQHAASGGAVKLDKDPAEQRGPALQPSASVPYSPLAPNLRPVRAVRTGKLRDKQPIDAATVTKINRPRPIRPKPPTESGGPEGAAQRAVAAVAAAPIATGLSFDGVSVGLADYTPASNPPDVNGNVGATQYLQWNNTAFAIFDKTTGALQYGPAAGNTLFQELGGICAQFNDGDPVVSYDILAGRWVLSQFVAGASQTSFSHQCFAVSAISDDGRVLPLRLRD